MILDSLFTSLFRPGDGPLEIEGAVSVAIFAILALTLALPDAGRLATGGPGAIGLCALLWFTFLVGWFWLGSAMALIAKLWGGKGSVEATLGAVAQACWPLLLVAPAVAAGNAGLAGVEHLAVVLIAVWIAVLLVAFIRRAHSLSWSRSLGAWVLLAGTSALTGLILLSAAAVLAVVVAIT